MHNKNKNLVSKNTTYIVGGTAAGTIVTGNGGDSDEC